MYSTSLPLCFCSGADTFFRRKNAENFRPSSETTAAQPCGFRVQSKLSNHCSSRTILFLHSYKATSVHQPMYTVCYRKKKPCCIQSAWNGTFWIRDYGCRNQFQTFTCQQREPGQQPRAAYRARTRARGYLVGPLRLAPLPTAHVFSGRAHQPLRSPDTQVPQAPQPHIPAMAPAP